MSVTTMPSIMENYILGEAFSHHYGIRCYPAIEKSSGRKTVVKVYSIPEKPSVTEALLLCGAFNDKTELDEYYKSRALSICRQVALLNALSQSNSFSSYLACQSVPSNDIGYEVYLLSPYHKTLSAIFEKQLFSKDDVISLGISLCKSMEICRDAGYQYVGLKPENIFYAENGQFQVGDIGFISHESLSYAMLPAQYHTAYTPKQSHDCYSSIPFNCDVYGIGMILLQAYAGGKLPVDIPEEDDSLLTVIKTACNPIDNDRYQTPNALSDALTALADKPE